VSDARIRLEQRKKLQALKKFTAFQLAYSRADVWGMIDAVGIPTELLEEMSDTDVADAINVRAFDLAVAAGLEPMRKKEK